MHREKENGIKQKRLKIKKKNSQKFMFAFKLSLAFALQTILHPECSIEKSEFLSISLVLLHRLSTLNPNEKKIEKFFMVQFSLHFAAPPKCKQLSETRKYVYEK